MEELKEIVKGLDKISKKLKEIIEAQEDESLYYKWRAYNEYVAPPHKTHKEITNG
jgi:hypothetical protein